MSKTKSLAERIINLKELTRVETLSDVQAQIEEEIFSAFPIRTLGYSDNGLALLTEEQRESHVHILGAPGEGKSKLIEMLVRQDIQRGYGACVIDPSENGDTAKRILKYCASIGFEKVCFINPEDFNNKVPVFNPIKYDQPASISVGNVMDALQVLWSSTFNNTPRIQRYATALLNALHASQNTLVESVHFFTHGNIADKMLESLSRHSLHRVVLTLTGSARVSSLDTTLNRFGLFQDETLRLLLGSKRPGIPFYKMITEGWLILVNLDPQAVWGTEQIQQRLLGTLIISEVVYAIHRLRANHWKGVYYLYIDEVGDYATSKLAFLLDKKRKTGLRMTLAHQRFDQIEDKNVLSAVRGSAKIKVLFFTSNIQDRIIMLKDMGFGGDEITDRRIAHVLGDLERQHCAVRIHRQPFLIRLDDVRDTHVDDDDLETYKKFLYSYPWFYPAEEIKQEINERFRPTQSGGNSIVQERGNLESPGSGEVPDDTSVGESSQSGKGQSYFHSQVPKGAPIRSGLRRRRKGTAPDGKGRPGQKTPKKK